MLYFSRAWRQDIELAAKYLAPCMLEYDFAHEQPVSQQKSVKEQHHRSTVDRISLHVLGHVCIFNHRFTF